MMKHLGLVVLLGACLLACTSAPTLDELVYQANLSGDWSAVEQHERLVDKRRSRLGASCPQGQLAYCEPRAASKRCECVSGDNVRSVFSSY